MLGGHAGAQGARQCGSAGPAFDGVGPAVWGGDGEDVGGEGMVEEGGGFLLFPSTYFCLGVVVVGCKCDTTRWVESSWLRMYVFC